MKTHWVSMLSSGVVLQQGASSLCFPGEAVGDAHHFTTGCKGWESRTKKLSRRHDESIVPLAVAQQLPRCWGGVSLTFTGVAS